MNIKAMVKEKEDKRMLNIMKRYINIVCNKEFGFKPVKYTIGRKIKGLYIYTKENSKPVFLSLEKYKDDSITDEEMKSIIKNLIIKII